MRNERMEATARRCRPCAAGGRQSSCICGRLTARMRVEVVRRGGLVGIPLRGVVDTAELPADVASRAEAALRGLPFGQPPPPPSPDRFQYQITVLDDGDARSAVINEADVSP